MKKDAFYKFISVFLAVASMVFLGFVVAYASGGVNWNSEMIASDMAEYNFQVSEGEEPKWSVTGPDGQVASGEALLPSAILKARKDLDKRQKAELSRIQQLIPEVQTELDTLEQLQEIDTKALAARFAQLKEYSAAINRSVLEQSDFLAARIRETTKTRTEAENRRNDVYRLTNELEVLRTDRARLVQLRRELADELLRLQITLNSLKQRADQSLGG